MAIVALHSASTGLSALSADLDVIANNLANVNTVGFKASRSNFENLLYMEKKQPGVENANGDARPAGLYVGMGTQISNTQFDFKTGSPRVTDRDLDMMIVGQGFFQVNALRGGENVTAYTRAGNFFRNSDGDLVLGSHDGPRLIPPINIPAEITSISISAEGLITGTTQGNAEPIGIGQLEISTFINPHGLEAAAGNLFFETSASGPPITDTPTNGNLGGILSGAIEMSNVDPVTELVSLIKTQRAFEMNSQSIQSADQALQVVSNLRR